MMQEHSTSSEIPVLLSMRVFQELAIATSLGLGTIYKIRKFNRGLEYAFLKLFEHISIRYHIP